jgi:predicted dehydrogenase
MAMNKLAAAFVRDGGIGKVHFVQGVNYPGPERYARLPEEPVPGDLDWDMWQGQTTFKPYNTALHRRWMRWWDYSGGETTNWGAHGLDQIQFALGTDQTGPIEFWPLAEGPPGAIAYRYASGITVRLEMPAGELNAGAVFVGTKARMEIIRNNFRTDPPRMVPNLPPPEEVQKWRDDVALWQAKYHMEEWLECVRSRRTPSADVEIGHRSVSICHLVNITRQLGRRLRWNPDAEQLEGDAEANALLSRPRRKGYELPAIG